MPKWAISSTVYYAAPNVNVHAVEQAVLDHYATLSFSAAFRAEVRAGLDEALTHGMGSTQKVRERLAARLPAA